MIKEKRQQKNEGKKFAIRKILIKVNVIYIHTHTPT